ncbi:glycosyltransferase [Lutimonas halocynthiae]|uniref:glycosyltransferase n=1 Tax=Lutimonas halocynthiae TaxID=1446477 RepID=UPI0025B36631|nr:glycosyltransferase [Lutimonas halocynthiae]MDN3643794.1 glycosyltransferase [Lutimonas halocynthiae]
MKVLNLSNVAGVTSGGIGDVAQAMTRHQNKLNVESNLWFPGGDDKKTEVHKLTGVPLNQIEAIKTIGPHHLGIAPSLIKKRHFAIENFDIIHQHGAFLPISLFTKSLSKKIKILISPHGLFEPERLEMQSRKKAIARFVFENSNFKKSACLVTCSNQEALNLAALKFNVPIAILPNGIEESFLLEKTTVIERTSFRDEKNIPIDKRVLLFISRIHPLKGLPLLLEVILKIKAEFQKSNWLLVIAGIDENNHEQELKKLVKEYNLEELVQFVGPVFGREKILMFDIASTFILPSHNENFGIVVIEALARGIPVITTKNTPWADLEDFNCGWWVDRNEKSITLILEKLLKLDSQELSTMGESGKKLVEKKYLWTSIARQSISLYKWILSDYSEDFKSGFQLLEK